MAGLGWVAAAGCRSPRRLAHERHPQTACSPPRPTLQLAACYQAAPFPRPGSFARRRPQHKRRNSDELGGADGDAGDADDETLPLSSSAPAGSSAGLAAAAEAEAAGRGGGAAATAVRQLQWSASVGQRMAQQLAGRSAAVLTTTGQVLTSTGQLAVRSSSGLLRRVWPAGACGGADGGGGAGAAGTGAGEPGSPAQAPAADAAPAAMEVDEQEAPEEEQLELELEAEQQLAVSFEERRYLRAQLLDDA